MSSKVVVETKKAGPKYRKKKSKPQPKVEVIVESNGGPKFSRKQRSFQGSVNKFNLKSGANYAQIAEVVKCAEHTPETRAGRAMIKQIINPCGEGPNPDFAGITNGTGVSAANVKLRDDVLIAPPTYGDTEDAWSLIIFSTPYLSSQQIYIRFLTGMGPPSRASIIGVLNGLTITEWDVNCRYPSFYQPVNFITLAGLVEPYDGKPFELSVLVPAGLSNSFNSQSAAPGYSWIRKWMYLYKGYTCHLNAPDLANEGRIIQSSTSTESANKNIRVQSTDPQEVVNVRYTVSPPFEDNVLPMQDTEARQDVFKKGSYSVQRHWNNPPVWNESEDIRPIWRVENAATIGAGRSVDSTVRLKVDGFDMNMGWMVENIRGLNNKAEVHIKHRSGIAFNVTGDSPWAAFMTDAPKDDPGAIKLMAKLAIELPHTYEACFNDMGFLGGIISKVLGGVSGLLPNILGVGANFLHGLVDKGQDKAERAMQKYSSYGGGSEYGDRGLTDRRRRH